MAKTMRDVFWCTAELEIGGWKPAVSSVTIDLTAGNIPTATVIIDPWHEYINPVTPALKSSLDMLATAFEMAKRFAADPATKAYLAIDVVPVSSNSDARPQTVQLTDWIVTGAGLTGVSATGQFALEITLQHPIGKLDRSLGTLGNTAGQTDWKLEDFDDLVSALASAFRTWAETLRVAPVTEDTTCLDNEGAPDITTAMTNARDALKEKADEITTYLKWVSEWPNNSAGYSAWPFEKNCLAAVVDSVKNAFTVYTSNFCEQSIWSVISNQIADEWQTTVIPTYWDSQLQLCPFTPWGNPVITVYDDQISDISFPGIDPAPIGGTRVSFDPGQGSMDVSFWPTNNINAETETMATEVVYLPEKSITDLCGRILNFTSPSWWREAMSGDVGVNGKTKEPGEMEKDSLITGENADINAQLDSGGGNQITPVTAEFCGALYGMAQQFFLTSYQSQMETSFLTYFMLSSKDSGWPEGFVIPGCVVRLKCRATGKVLFDTYIRRVIHNLSVSGKLASTEWIGVYCRPENEFEGMATNGTWNPMYK